MFNQSSRKTAQCGRLYIVATPIGNRDDMSLRAIQTLKSVDTILAEDTRHSKLLLDALGIATPLISFHAHNENEKTGFVLDALQKGTSFALISDAGTPLISDPGFPLVKMARSLHIAVIPIPGPCAVTAALCASGVPCDTFTFVGFLPAKKNQRLEALKTLQSIPHTVVLYESTHRIVACLEDIGTLFGTDYVLVLAKELTKSYEHFIHDRLEVIQQWLAEEEAHTKGEFVLILPAHQIVPENQDEALLKALLEELPVKQAVQIATKLTKTPKNALYALALEMKQR